MTEEEKRLRLREQQKKYFASEKGKAARLRAQRKYLATERGKTISKLSMAQWRAMGADDARRRPLIKQATPGWADVKAITDVYLESARRALAGECSVVDHIVPLRSELVCGLHVHENLGITTKSENSAKGNRFWPDMP